VRRVGGNEDVSQSQKPGRLLLTQLGSGMKSGMRTSVRAFGMKSRRRLRLHAGVRVRYGRPAMNAFFLHVLFAFAGLAIPARSPACSPEFTFEEIVERCTAILEVTILEASPPKTDNLIEPAVCKATVTDVLKGDKNLKQIEFRFVPYGDYAPAKLPGIVGKKYLLFFHTLEGKYWVFRPAGFNPAEESRKLAKEVRQQLTKKAK
jgi:hypothetical protein